MGRMMIGAFAIHCPGEADEFCQSIFAQGNGRLGIRGFACDEEKCFDHDHGVFAAGLFEEIKAGITDMVQLPDPYYTRLHQPLPPMAMQTLDMSQGLLRHVRRGGGLTIESNRFVSLADPDYCVLRYAITPEQDSNITLDTGLDGRVANLPVADDQRVKNDETVRLLHPVMAGNGELHMEMLPSRRKACWSYALHVNLPAGLQDISGDGRAVTRITVAIAAGQTLIVDKIVCTPIFENEVVPGLTLQEAAKLGYDGLLKRHRDAWAAVWLDCDIALQAEEALQGAVRYNLFQLLQNAPAGDGRAGIGARGLMHGRYKGNSFWDTDIFMLPFFQYTRLQTGTGLVRYRLRLLNDAMENAKAMNLYGARYPWMCADTGREQCESWDTGSCEIHITADVVYAISQYLQVTGDESIRNAYQALLRETARYWMSRITYEKEKDRYSILFVKGPDEYCGVTQNNTYTNFLVRHNLRLAALESDAPKEERESFREAAEKLVVLYDAKRNLYLQDELFERLEPLPTKKTGDASLYRQVCFDRLQRYKVLKQADLVLLMTLFPDDFTLEQKRNVWDFYEPCTLHDSSLSFGVHAQLAAQLGLIEQAERYFHKAAYLDLLDIMENTAREGIHPGAMGTVWQALVLGMAGLHAAEGVPVLAPHLPPSINGMRFSFYYRGKRYTAEITDNQALIRTGGE